MKLFILFAILYSAISYSGAIEGVVRDATNLKQATAYRSFRPATDKLKIFFSIF